MFNTPLALLTIGAMLLLGGVCTAAHADFNGKPPLTPDTALRHEFAPYDLAKLNCLGLTYCENLCDLRVNLTSYTHQQNDMFSSDAWHLQFPDDTARFVEGLVFEAQYSPVARVELARRMLKGLMAAQIPGTRAEYFFRHRSGGKTYLIFDDSAGEKQGRLTLSTWGDTIEGMVKVGFRAKMADQWRSIEEFKYTDTPEGCATPGKARSKTWHESPYFVARRYASDAGAVEFAGRYGLSDEDLPIEYAFSSPSADELEVVIGEPGKHMPLLWDKDTPGYIHLPDRETVHCSSDQGAIKLEAPAYNYFILRKPSVWCSPNYSSALLVMWEGKPSSIEALPALGYGEIRIRFAKQGDAAGGKVWLYPIPWLNEEEINYVHRNGETFLATGKLPQNGYPSQQLVNAIPATLAAGALMMTRYNDPIAATVRVHAENAVDTMLLPEEKGQWFARTFFEVKAAAWMVLLGKETGDQAMVAKYTPWVERIMERMFSEQVGYDGAAWIDGWSHFNCIKAVELAYEATGREDYKQAWERAMAVYTIDEKGIYKRGEALKAPGGFDTYSGALPMAIWGYAGMLDNINKLINLDVPNGWDPDPKVPVRDIWHDGGAGPWAQDDSQPDFVGYCLKGLNIPRPKQYIVPVGSGVMYDALGEVKLLGGRLVESPFFREGADPLRIIKAGEKPAAPEQNETVIAKASGQVAKAGEAPIIHAIPLDSGVTGIALDMTLQGGAYQVAVSPDGQRWFQRLDSWSPGMEKRSLDLSFLTGSADEMVKLMTIEPPADSDILTANDKTRIEREHCRYVDAGGSFVYKLPLSQVTEAYAEVVTGNGYRVEISPDGVNWMPGINAKTSGMRAGEDAADAGWVRLVNLTPALGVDGFVYIRFTDEGQTGNFGGLNAFLRRLTVYGVMKTDTVHVRLVNADKPEGAPLEVRRIALRTWKTPAA